MADERHKTESENAAKMSQIRAQAQFYAENGAKHTRGSKNAAKQLEDAAKEVAQAHEALHLFNARQRAQVDLDVPATAAPKPAGGAA